MSFIKTFLLLAFCCAEALYGQPTKAGPELKGEELPRVPPTPPEKALSTFRVKPGFKIELVAAEPLVVDPIALCFDENNRLFVVEMRDYSERRDERLGRIRLLEDTNDDGRMDTSTVFAEDLPWPTALFWYDGGLFVGATPDILYFKDTNNDRKADQRTVAFTGFAAEASPLNVQALLNSFNWSLDNRIHGSAGLSGGMIRCPSHLEHSTLHLRGNDFSFDPKTLLMRAESGGGQYGLAFDNYGRRFICSNSSHLRQVMYENRYLIADMTYSLPPPALDIPADGPSAEVFRISPDEPWRVIRTKWRVSGLVPGPIEGGGRSSGYFTSATGLTLYRGDALGVDFVGNEFVADCGSNLVHRKKIRPNGVAFLGERPDNEQKSEFLASSDNWFRPVQLANGPDGALYIADMYREVIEHPWSLPENLKKHLDLNSGNDRGRIYRIVPENFRRPKLPKLAHASLTELVAALQHPNGWCRDTASRLLYERQDPTAIEPLKALFKETKSPLARLHALHALSALKSLGQNDLLRGLKDDDAGVRENAIRLTEPIIQKNVSEQFWSEFERLAQDSSPRVRYQLAWTLTAVSDERKWRLLGRLLATADDPWIRHAVLASSSAAPSRVWLTMSDAARFDHSATELLRMAGRSKNTEEWAAILSAVEKLEPHVFVRGFAALLRGARTGGDLNRVTAARSFGRAVAEARMRLTVRETAPELAADAIVVVAAHRSPVTDALLLEQLKPHTGSERQRAAIELLAERKDPSWARSLFTNWNSLTPQVRESAVVALLKTVAHTKAVLAAIVSGEVSRTAIPLHEIERLRRSKDSDISRLAEAAFGQKTTVPMQQLVERYKSAISLPGNAANGERIYAERCASCHRLQGQGSAVGPDMESVRQAGRETALQNILDPNREVAPRYLNYDVDTADGETHSGIIVQDTPASITLRQANGVGLELPRNSISKLHSSGKSLMPEGLEQGLSAQEMADLLAYILGSH